MLNAGVLRLRQSLVTLFATLFVSSLTAATNVATLRSAEWSPGDRVRDGAGEFEVLICAAKLQQSKCAGGIVGLGDRHGLFLAGAEHALHTLALRGIPIAKLPRGGDLAADPEGLFLDASGLTESQASAVLSRCLELYGTPPTVADCAHPTETELAAIRTHLAHFRQAFDMARFPRFASKGSISVGGCEG